MPIINLVGIFYINYEQRKINTHKINGTRKKEPNRAKNRA